MQVSGKRQWPDGARLTGNEPWAAMRHRGLMGSICPIPGSTQLIPNRTRQRPRTGTAEPRIDGFESPDEIEHLGAGIRAARRRAEMGAAAERAILINQASPVFAQHRTCAVVALGHHLSPRSAQRPRGQHRLALRELRRAPGELELAALGAADARAFDGAIFQFPVDGAKLPPTPRAAASRPCRASGKIFSVSF